MKEKKQIPAEEAEKLLPDKKIIHVFRIEDEQLLGVEFNKSKVIDLIRSRGAELAGDNARMANHGLCVIDENGEPLFVETRREA